MIKHILKVLLIVPVYLFLALEGFFGGGTGIEDKWDKLYAWAKR